MASADARGSGRAQVHRPGEAAGCPALPDDILTRVLAYVTRRSANRRGFWAEARLVSRGWRALHDRTCNSLVTAPTFSHSRWQLHSTHQYNLRSLLRRLSVLTQLRISKIFRPKEVISTIAGMDTLSQLTIHGAYIDDDDLATLTPLSGLVALDITSNVRVTDGALPHLARFTGLTALNLDSTSISVAGRVRLKAALPTLSWCP